MMGLDLNSIPSSILFLFLSPPKCKHSILKVMFNAFQVQLRAPEAVWKAAASEVGSDAWWVAVTHSLGCEEEHHNDREIE